MVALREPHCVHFSSRRRYHPGSGRGKVEITVKGALAEILKLGQRQPGALVVVAGEGLEPPTLGL
jgi:hypothetical protein